MQLKADNTNSFSLLLAKNWKILLKKVCTITSLSKMYFCRIIQVVAGFELTTAYTLGDLIISI